MLKVPSIVDAFIFIFIYLPLGGTGPFCLASVLVHSLWVCVTKTRKVKNKQDFLILLHFMETKKKSLIL